MTQNENQLLLQQYIHAHESLKTVLMTPRILI